MKVVSVAATEVADCVNTIISLVEADQSDFPTVIYQGQDFARHYHEGMTDALKLELTIRVNLPDQPCFMIKNDAVLRLASSITAQQTEMIQVNLAKNWVTLWRQVWDINEAPSLCSYSQHLY